jgi:L,D-peptidoglycan transpeptidase YkuD (ErfK/YbiS/YcfS/YnhG family)
MKRKRQSDNCGKFLRSPAIIVRTAPGNRNRAIVQVGPLVFYAAIGRSGRTSRKREGDGATPIARMALIEGYVRGEHPGQLRTTLPIRRIRSDMLWCDQPDHANYNRPVRAPFSKSHERLMRPDHLYDIVLVMDWNISSRKRGAGSAIFFHLARPGYAPTEGCVAVKRRDMERLLPLMKAGRIVEVR